MFINITPVAKPRMTQRDRWMKRPAVVKYHQFCDAWRSKYTGEIPDRLYLTFFVPMPKSWSNKKRAQMQGRPHQVRPDSDNFAKSVLDAGKKDDSHVYILHVEKYWAERPGIEIHEYEPGQV